MKKLISLVLVLILVCSLLPMAAAAAQQGGPVYGRDENGGWHEIVNDQWGPTITDSAFAAELEEGFRQYLASIGLTMEDIAPQPAEDVYRLPVHLYPFEHDLGWNSNTKYHWKECVCGARFGEELHIDPKDAENDYCECGYHFSSNADLVTLWVKGCPGIKNFNKDTTEYTLDAYTYKDVKEIKISTRTHDSEATVELPEDLTLKEGENKFEVKVTAENQKVTKVYTLIINKEPQK